MGAEQDSGLYSPKHIATLIVNGIAILLGLFITIFSVEVSWMVRKVWSLLSWNAIGTGL